MQAIIDFLNSNLTHVIQAIVVILTAIGTIIQQFKKQDK
nr:MAG: hypothetical protein [Microviridae sp.]